jgi:peptidoglycan/xylan/chitin deacetylase (PgdA/CDA1 family)
LIKLPGKFKKRIILISYTNFEPLNMKNKVNLGIPTRRMFIKKHARNIVSTINYYSGLSSIWYWLYAKRAVRILTYHGIELSPTNSYNVSLSNFEKQIDYIYKKYNVISLPQYLNNLEKKIPFSSNTIIITFDDGFRNFYEHAYPILKKYQIPATCFIITSKVGNSKGNYMNWEELKEIASDGLITIGAHSVTHKSLPSLNDVNLQHEIRDSKFMIEINLGIPVICFSYPYGTRRDFNDRSERYIQQNGYRLAFTSISGCNSLDVNPFELRRSKIEWGDGLPTFEKILVGALDIWFLFDRWFSFLQKREKVQL